jgi:hypothetical protein
MEQMAQQLQALMGELGPGADGTTGACRVCEQTLALLPLCIAGAGRDETHAHGTFRQSSGDCMQGALLAAPRWLVYPPRGTPSQPRADTSLVLCETPLLSFDVGRGCAPVFAAGAGEAMRATLAAMANNGAAAAGGGGGGGFPAGLGGIGLPGMGRAFQGGLEGLGGDDIGEDLLSELTSSGEGMGLLETMMQQMLSKEVRLPTRHCVPAWTLRTSPSGGAGRATKQLDGVPRAGLRG